MNRKIFATVTSEDNKQYKVYEGIFQDGQGVYVPPEPGEISVHGVNIQYTYDKIGSFTSRVKVYISLQNLGKSV